MQALTQVLTDAQVLSLNSAVVWWSFAISLALGWVMNWSNFCTMGAVSDIVNMGDWTRMRTWLAAIGVAVLGTHLLAGLGYIDLSKTIYTGNKLVWLSNAVGGALFGFGMVLASGCGSKTLVRIGGGSLKSFVVFVVLGLSAYMTMKGIIAIGRVNTVDAASTTLSTSQSLGYLISTKESLKTTQLILGVIVGLALLVFAFKSSDFRNRYAITATLVIGLSVIAMWWVSGNLGYVADHPKTLEEAFLGTNSGRMEALSFVAPIAYTLELLMLWSDTSKVVTLGIASAMGMVLGSFIHALISRTFLWEGFRGTEDTANHLVGAAFMGAGGVTALGCTVGQGLSGLSTLALGSIITFVFILAGAWAGLKYQIWRVEQQI